MNTQRLIRIYQSKPIWEMDKSTLKILHRGMSNWLWLPEIATNEKKREELYVVLHHIKMLIRGDDLYRETMRALF